MHDRLWREANAPLGAEFGTSCRASSVMSAHEESLVRSMTTRADAFVRSMNSYGFREELAAILLCEQKNLKGITKSENEKSTAWWARCLIYRDSTSSVGSRPG